MPPHKLIGRHAHIIQRHEHPPARHRHYIDVCHNILYDSPEATGEPVCLCGAVCATLQHAYHATRQHFHILGHSLVNTLGNRPAVTKRRARRLLPRQSIYDHRSNVGSVYRHIHQSVDNGFMHHNRHNIRATRLLSNS